MYGGAAPNPMEALARIIGKLKDENGKILIPHFYDRVLKPSADELQAWKSLSLQRRALPQTEVGSKELTGESGYSVLERTWARPYARGAWHAGGFIGAGGKTVIPPKRRQRSRCAWCQTCVPTRYSKL